MVTTLIQNLINKYPNIVIQKTTNHGGPLHGQIKRCYLYLRKEPFCVIGELTSVEHWYTGNIQLCNIDGACDHTNKIVFQSWRSDHQPSDSLNTNTFEEYFDDAVKLIEELNQKKGFDNRGFLKVVKKRIDAILSPYNLSSNLGVRTGSEEDILTFQLISTYDVYTFHVSVGSKYDGEHHLCVNQVETMEPAASKILQWDIRDVDAFEAYILKFIELKGI